MNPSSTCLVAVLIASLGAARAVGDVLLATDFNAANDWPTLAAFSPVGTGLTVTGSRAAVGTIDDATGNASGAIVLNVETAPSTAAWRAGLSSRRLALANREPALAKLTLSFDLWTRLAQPVRVRLHAFSSATGPTPTGTLEAVVVPPVASSYFRHSLDLSVFAAPIAGGGAFDPLAPFIELQFEIDSTDGWIAATGDALRVDNV